MSRFIGYKRSHQWMGGSCASCGMRSHWPGAKASCSGGAVGASYRCKWCDSVEGEHTSLCLEVQSQGKGGHGIGRNKTG